MVRVIGRKARGPGAKAPLIGRCDVPKIPRYEPNTRGDMGTRTSGRRPTGRLGQQDLRCDDIVAPPTNTETWVECRVCQRAWPVPRTPGLIRCYVVCDRCRC
jgi:hypothetical protein